MNKNEFELKKVKVNDKGQCEIIYLHHQVVEGVGFFVTHSISSPKTCHPDLEAALNELSPYLADANHLRVYRDEALKLKLTKQTLKALDQHIFDSVSVSGIALAGNKDNRSVIITGKHQVHHTAVAMNSPKMFMDGDTFGFENMVDKISKDVVNEVYQYLFGNKGTMEELALKVEPEEEPAAT